MYSAGLMVSREAVAASLRGAERRSNPPPWGGDCFASLAMTATEKLLLAKQPAQGAGVVPLDVGDAPVGADLEQLDQHLLGLAEIGEAHRGLGLGTGLLHVDREVGDLPVLVADEGI